MIIYIGKKNEQRHLMREAYNVKRDEIFIDLYDKLEKLKFNNYIGYK